MSRFNGYDVNFVLVLVLSSVVLSRSVVGSPVIVKRLSRPDPLHCFQTYRGGYDIGNKHYWASAAFTGVHGYGVAAIWMLMGIGFGVYFILKICICSNTNNNSSSYSDASYIILFSLVLIFTLLALMATGLTITGNQMSVQRTRILKETLFRAGDDVEQTIESVTLVLHDMETILRPYKRKTCQLLNATSQRLDNGSREIQSFLYHSRHSSKLAVEALYIANLVVVSVDMAFFIAALDCCFGSVLLFFHWHPGFVIVILFCWILATLSWMMTGFDFFFHTFIEDTCAAFEDFNNNPQNSSLKSMLSCADSSAADKILLKIGKNVHKFISELNAKITELRQILVLTGQDLALLGVSEICDPFPTGPEYTYKPEDCPNDAVSIGDIPDLLSKFTCYEENVTSCEENARYLSESTYNKAWAYSQSIQDLINVYPNMERLARCSSVDEAISDIVFYQCEPLKTSVMMLWGFMLSLSIVTVILTLLLVAKAYQDRGRAFSKCSIIPDSS